MNFFVFLLRIFENLPNFGFFFKLTRIFRIFKTHFRRFFNEFSNREAVRFFFDEFHESLKNTAAVVLIVQGGGDGVL